MAETQRHTAPEHRSAGAAMAAEVNREKAHRDRGRNLGPLKHLWPFIARYPGWLALFLLFLALSSAATLILPLIMRIIIDCGFGNGANGAEFCQRVAVSGDTSMNGYFLLAIAGVLLFSVLGSMRYYFITTLGQRVIADIRKAVYNQLTTLDIAYFERIRTGEVLSRLTTDTTLIETVLTGSFSFAIRSFVIIIGSIIMMFVVSWKLAMMVLAIGPAIIIPALIIGRRLKRLSRDGQDRLAESSARAGEAISSIQTVQAFTREAEERRIFGNVTEATFKVQKRRIITQTAMTMIIFMISLTAICGVFWYGAVSVQSGAVSGGVIAAFSVYAFFTVSNSSMLIETYNNLLRASGASERLVDILQSQSGITAPDDAGSIERAEGHIAFNDVTFSYPSRPSEQALKDVSFDIKPGETIALVGPSGAGKSTVFQLLLRFYDCQSGTITLDDHDITALAPQNLRNQFAIVQQNSLLFSGSAMENIRYGRLDATDAEVIEAAKAAYAHDFIAALPEGYDTDLGERATTLSGGQKQRITIARAILRDAPILLLDEATSALDSESERAVQKAFETMSRNKTTLVIAHRLATVMEADRIFVMEDGRIVETGTHKSLQKSGGLYARLAELQFDVNGG